MKRKILTFLFLAHCAFVLSQPIPVDSIVAFYKKADIECYKEIIHRGMQDFDLWLKDTLPSLTRFAPFYSPSNIDIREYDAIPFVSLCFYNMSEYNEKESIYEHIIIDSTRCMVLVPIGKKGNLIGLTDSGSPYSFISFENKKDINYRIGYKRLKHFIKECKKYEPDALVMFSTPYPRYKEGFVKDSKIFYLTPSPRDINDFMHQDFELFSDTRHIKALDLISYPTYRESFAYEGGTKRKKTGDTPPQEVRLCPK